MCGLHRCRVRLLFAARRVERLLTATPSTRCHSVPPRGGEEDPDGLAKASKKADSINGERTRTTRAGQNQRCTTSYIWGPLGAGVNAEPSCAGQTSVNFFSARLVRASSAQKAAAVKCGRTAAAAMPSRCSSLQQPAASRSTIPYAAAAITPDRSCPLLLNFELDLSLQ